MKFYAGIDLHSNNLVQVILTVLAMYKEQIEAVAIESTYKLVLAGSCLASRRLRSASGEHSRRGGVRWTKVQRRQI
jgi:hypothetical protein